MKKLICSVSLFVAILSLNLQVAAQTTKEILNWYNGASPGMNTEKAYKLLKGKKGAEVIVGVIDSGVDIEHEDLKGKIWTNTKEIPGNKIDDDKNGYVDDIHGWNFLGNANGKNIEHENLEFTRIYRNLSPRFNNKSESDIASNDKELFALYLECKKRLESEKADAEAQLTQINMLLEQVLPMVPKMIAKELGKENYTLKDLKKWKPKDPNMEQIKMIGTAMLSGELTDAEMKEGLTHFKNQVEYNLNPSYNPRADVMGDDPDDFSRNNYGNGDVEGPDALHGTHVSGIICAVRGNKLGGDGVADNVKIMSLRAVPDGDEYDKDIALAIRYAVDNGASIINMSFGKAFSPHQREVYDAMKYAESKGVLLVHAAGNDAANNDEVQNYPSAKYSFQTEPLNNLLSIGANTRNAKGSLAASFSNYGAKSVDIFAPGYEIYNTIPDNKYRKLQGTSMAAPMVAGAAAFLKSYFPSLTMFQIRDILLKSGTSYATTEQTLPGTDKKVKFSTLCTTGAVINLDEAVKMAMAMTTAQKN